MTFLSISKGAVTGVFALIFSLSLFAKPAVQIQDDKIVFTNAGAEYFFTPEDGAFSLSGCQLNGQNTGLTKFGYSLMKTDLSWINAEKLGKWSYQILEKGDAVTFQTQVAGKNVRLLREYTLKGNSPALEIHIRAEYDQPETIRWAFLFGSKINKDRSVLRLRSEVQDGTIKTRLHAFPKSPFLDENGKVRKVLRQQFNKWTNVFMLGSYDPTTKTGFLAETDLERTPWPMEVLQQKPEGAVGFSVAPYVFSLAENGLRYQEVLLTVTPFTGELSEAEKIAAPFIQRLEKASLLHGKALTGKTIYAKGDLSVWTDFPQARIFSSEKAPAQKAPSVEIFAAKGERESFQIALRSKKQHKEITLDSLTLSNGENAISLSWNPIQMDQATDPEGAGGDSSVYGELPDMLAKCAPVQLNSDETKSFYLTANVPEDAVSGLYQGVVKVLSQGKEIAAVPVSLRVWRFSLKERTVTVAMDWWLRSLPQADMYRTFEETGAHAVRNKGGLRWVATPTPEWNDDGTLRKIDYSKFDADMERAEKEFRHQLFICRPFMLGYNHKPQKTLFGSAKQILKPSFNAKIEAYAVDFRKHLIEKGWNGKVIMDIFDEPEDQWYPMIHQVVAMLHKIAPEWKFTFAGAYAPGLEKSIKFWNLPWYMATKDFAQRAEKNHAEIGIYNLQNVDVTQNPLFLRGSLLHMYHKNIRYMYQWIINWWAQETSGSGDWHHVYSSARLAKDGHVYSTMRLEAACDGIEDYEYAVRLGKAAQRLSAKNPALAKQAATLLEESNRLAWSSPNDELLFITAQNPALFEDFHRRAGELLDKIEGL